MLLFFAATEARQHREAAIKGGVKNSLQSFYSLGCGKGIPSNKEFENYLLDSGGFSARKHGLTINVKDYAKYLNNYKIEVAFNLDVMDNAESLKNQRYLEEHTNTYVLPVYHGTEWLDKKWDGLLDYYIEHYPFISLGGMAGKETSEENMERFRNFVFSKTRDKVMVHGLGMTNIRILQKCPFFTVDSTSWMSPALFAGSSVHSPEWMKANAKSRHFSYNILDEIPYWLNFEKDFTRLWERRGLKWGNFDYNYFMSKRAKKIPTFEEWKGK